MNNLALLSRIYFAFCARFAPVRHLIYRMKLKYFLIFAATLFLSGCSYYAPESHASWPGEDGAVTYRTEVTAVVTVRRAEDGTVFFRYGKLELLPDGWYGFTHTQRALGQLVLYPERLGNYYRCSVEWLEPLEEGGYPEAPAGASDDGVDVLTNSWITGVEDGYLTIHYNTWWGRKPLHHDFYLKADGDPMCLRLIHDAHSDERYEQGEGVVCFDISSLAGDGPLTLKWRGTDGTERTTAFEFTSAGQPE